MSLRYFVQKFCFATSMVRLEVQRIWIGCCDMIACISQALFIHWLSSYLR